MCKVAIGIKPSLSSVTNDTPNCRRDGKKDDGQEGRCLQLPEAIKKKKISKNRMAALLKTSRTRLTGCLMQKTTTSRYVESLRLEH
jgi:hypothetical protein